MQEPVEVFLLCCSASAFVIFVSVPALLRENQAKTESFACGGGGHIVLINECVANMKKEWVNYDIPADI